MIENIQEKLNIFKNQFNLESIINTIISFVKEHAIIIIVVIVLTIILKAIIRAVYNSNSHERNFGTREYRNEILTSMPSQSKQDFTYLYQKLDELNNLINQMNTDLNRQREDVKSQIDDRIKEAQAEIENNWRMQQQKKEYYRCIGVHYASFTLANSIKREQEKIRDSFVHAKKTCDQYSDCINSLNVSIQKSSGSKRYELMGRHKDTCEKHKRMSKMKGMLGARNTQYLNMVKEQNIKTARYRDYIIANFGVKGRAWGRRIQRKKMDQIRN